MDRKGAALFARKIAKKKFSFGVKWAIVFAVTFEFILFYEAFAGAR